MRYYLISGEASGDLHGSRLMQGLQEADPKARFRFWGGDKMAARGGEMVRHYKDTAVMGFVEVAAKLHKISQNIRFCKQDILQYAPDVLILIDYPGFNLRIARFAKEHNIRVFYYIAPKVWAWKESRIKQLKEYVDKLFIIFPFEQEYFKKHGISANYFGNPLVDSVEEFEKSSPDPQVFCAENSLDQRPIIALLPGSRMLEIKYLIPRIKEVIPQFPEYQWVLASVPSIDPKRYKELVGDAPISIICDKTYSVLSLATVAVVSSGTATLETALLRIPQIVCYGGNPISFAIAKCLVKLSYVSLVNLIMDKQVVPELLQKDCNPTNIASALKEILPGRLKRRQMIAHYKRLRNILGKSGSASRIASAMVEEINPTDKNSYICHMRSPYGGFSFTSNAKALLSTGFDDPSKTITLGFFKSLPGSEEEIPISGADIPGVMFDTRKQLEEYFKGTRRVFQLPLEMHGTMFQENIWKEIQNIPYGTTISYAELAQRCGNAKAARAVGQASNANPFAIIIPCHRVIGNSGTLVGYAFGLDTKQQLLEREISLAPEISNALF